jgi:hypothetical protein
MAWVTEICEAPYGCSADEREAVRIIALTNALVPVRDGCDGTFPI